MPASRGTRRRHSRQLEDPSRSPRRSRSRPTVDPSPSVQLQSLEAQLSAIHGLLQDRSPATLSGPDLSSRLTELEASVRLLRQEWGDTLKLLNRSVERERKALERSLARLEDPVEEDGPESTWQPQAPQLAEAPRDQYSQAAAHLFSLQFPEVRV